LNFITGGVIHIEELFNRLSEAYKNYGTSVSADAKNGSIVFEIKNPHWEENIKVVDDGEITVYFSHQHAHMELMEKNNIDGVIEYINDFLDGKKVTVEFFVGYSNIFGGEKYLDDIDMSSGESILRSFLGGESSYYESLKGCDCRCEIRGWDSVHNKDVKFVI